MSREKLESMKGSELIVYADNLGVKVDCNKTRKQLKESKKNVIDRILAFEASQVKKEVVETVIDTESELSDEEYAKIGLEIAEQAKKKAESHKLVPMPGIEKLEVYKNEVELESVITKLQNAGFAVNIVKGLSKTISIKTVGQLAISKNGFRLKANLNFKFTSETSYETTKNYNKVMCDTLEDVLKIIQ